MASVAEISARNHQFGDASGLLGVHHVGAKGYPGRGGKGGRAAPEQVRKYEIDLFWSDEDGCFIVCVPDLENCAAWGDTHEEAMARAHEAIRADLASREKLGESVPAPRLRLLV